MIARYRPSPISTKRKHGMQPRVPLRQALSDPALLGNTLAGPSWARWKAILLATVGEPLTPPELALFKESTGREEPPTELVDEAAYCIGRRGGKDRAASVLICYFACLCDHPRLARGEHGLVFCTGPDQRQSKITRNYVEAALTNSPVLAPLIANLTQDSIQLTNGIDIEIRAANFRRVRGPTGVAVIVTESAFLNSDQFSANPDGEILAALRPTLATTGGPLIQISSVYAQRGELWETYHRHYGPNGDPHILVVKGTSREFNPTLPQSVIDRAMERDSASARAEYLSEWRTDVESFVSREVVQSCIDVGVHERPPLSKIHYSAFVDPAGGSGGDSATLAVAHREGETIFIDAVRETRPPFSPSNCIKLFAELLKQYRISRVTGDRWGGEFPREIFREFGIEYRCADRAKSDLYVDALASLNSHRVRLLDNPKLVAQLCSLERRTSRASKDVIDAPPNCHEDIANSIAGVVSILAAASPSIASLISPALLQASRAPSRHADLMSPRRQRMSSF